MKTVIATAFSALLLGALLTPAFADDQTSTDPTRHTMGDSGKLPATNSMSTQRFPSRAREQEQAAEPPALTQWAMRGNFLRLIA